MPDTTQPAGVPNDGVPPGGPSPGELIHDAALRAHVHDDVRYRTWLLAYLSQLTEAEARVATTREELCPGTAPRGLAIHDEIIVEGPIGYEANMRLFETALASRAAVSLGLRIITSEPSDYVVIRPGDVVAGPVVWPKSIHSKPLPLP